jgi:nucleoside-diphosphate-sugar epimerase
MTTVAVTGSSGYLGRVLLEKLSAHPAVTRVVGIDIAEPQQSSGDLEFYRMDVRSPDLAKVIEGCSVLVHLAFTLADDAAETLDVNVGGTRLALEAAVHSGVQKVVFASSTMVYGAHPDNDFPLTEASPVRPAHDDVYALSKVEAEGVMTYYAEAHPGTTVTILRMGWVAGPHLPTSHAFAVDSKVRFLVRGYDPPMQAVHEDDAVGAIVFSLTHALPSVFNVVADDAVDQPERLLGQRRVTLDLDRARRVLDRTARLGLSVSSADIGLLMYPQVLSNEALRAAGFAPAKRTEDALRDAALARRDWVALGKMRLRPRRIAMVAGTLGAVALRQVPCRRCKPSGRRLVRSREVTRRRSGSASDAPAIASSHAGKRI